MSINCDPDEGETQNSVLIICETWHVWRWDTNVVTQAEVEMYMEEGEIGIFGPGWKWARTWMEMRQEFGDLEAGEAGHGWRWSTYPETRMTQVVTHLNPGLYICVPSSSRWRLSSNEVTKIASLFHPGNISNQHKSQDVRLTSLQVLRDQHRGPNVLVSPPSMHHQCPNIRAACYLCLYHLHPSSENCMPVPSRHHP